MRKVNKLPRKLKKQIRDAVIKYNVAHLPNGYTMEKVEHLFKTTGVLYYSSDKYTGEGVEVDTNKKKNRGIKFVDLFGRGIKFISMEMTESSRRYCTFKDDLEKEFKDSLMVDAKYLGKRKEEDNE
tara:strand:+ start:1031 stop:1408 length:378 start_codon:yes stop_codon:yes gene_type:complete